MLTNVRPALLVSLAHQIADAEASEHSANIKFELLEWLINSLYSKDPNLGVHPEAALQCFHIYVQQCRRGSNFDADRSTRIIELLFGPSKPILVASNADDLNDLLSIIMKVSLERQLDCTSTILLSIPVIQAHCDVDKAISACRVAVDTVRIAKPDSIFLAKCQWELGCALFER